MGEKFVPFFLRVPGSSFISHYHIDQGKMSRFNAVAMSIQGGDYRPASLCIGNGRKAATRRQTSSDDLNMKSTPNTSLSQLLVVNVTDLTAVPE